jgi:alcohol dehydrogenase
VLQNEQFELQPGVRTSFGVGSVKKLGKRVKSLGAARAFVVTDRGLVAAGIVDRVRAALEVERVSVEVFDGVKANPTVESAHAGGEKLRANLDAVVIALGGGSSLDAAKAIALLGPNGGRCQDYSFGCRPDKPGRPIVAVPTTAGTGSETNMFGVVTDTAIGRKILVAHPSVLAQMVVLDPELTVDVPPRVTGTCGMDVLTHAVEAFTSRRANPMTDAIALRAIAMVGEYLPRAFHEGSDLEARSQMLLASHLAGIAFTSSGLGMCHAMGHPLSARLDAAHGQTLATLLPEVMRFNLPTCLAKYAEVAHALAAAEPAASLEANAQQAIAAVEKLRARVGTDLRGRELGLDPTSVPTLVEDAFADVLMASTPRTPEPADVARIYQTIY